MSSACRCWPATALPVNAGLAARAALALGYAAEIVLSPVGGAVAQRHEAGRLLVWLSIGSAGSLALVGTDLRWVGAVLMVILRDLLQPLPATVVAALNPGPARVPVLARLATWRDLGAAVGPLLAGGLLPRLTPLLLYGAAALLMALSAASLFYAEYMGERKPASLLALSIGPSTTMSHSRPKLTIAGWSDNVRS